MTQLRIPPSEFWNMRPRHFWILAETLRDVSAKPTLTEKEKASIRDMLMGNDHGGFF